MELHDAAKDDDIDRFRILLCGSPTKKPYPIFEEVSAKGYRWTCVHYAFHYGSWNCIRYILDYLTPLNYIGIVMDMKTKENKCPLLCLLKSNALKLQKKRDVFDKIISNYNIPVNDAVREELEKRGMSDLIGKIRPY